MHPGVGDELLLRATEERVRVVAVLDAAGTLLVETVAEKEAFQVAPGEVVDPAERHRGCACC